MTDPFRKPAPGAPYGAPLHHGMQYIAGSFVMEWTIEPGQTAVFTSKQCAEKQERIWLEGLTFAPSHLIYVGDPDLWLHNAEAARCACFGSGPLPMDSFRPGTHHDINWPVFSFSRPLELTVENRHRERTAHFAVRFGGKWETSAPC